MSRTLAALAITATAIACAACNTPSTSDPNIGKAKGKLTSTGGSLGDWVMTEATCRSGQRENYFGVIALGLPEEGTGVKLVKDPVQGFSAVVNIPTGCATQPEMSDCRAVLANRANCDEFRATLMRTQYANNDIRQLSGSLELDCTVGGGKLKGALTFTRCN